MNGNPESRFDLTRIAQELGAEGYVVLEGLLDSDRLMEWRGLIDRLAEQERRSPFLPGDGPVHPGDEEIESYLAESYAVSREELARMMQRVRHTRAENRDTPWPVGPREINKTFMHIPNLFDHDRSQYLRNLPAKTHLADALVEHPVVLGLARRLLGPDCVLGDVTATSIGPGTPGGPWHLDNPLTQMPEPLPDFPLGFQVAWMIDPFTAANGATRIVPRSHLTRSKPSWKRGDRAEETALCGKAGAVAIWLASTWHRIGPNSTDRPRRAIISFYQRSWIKPFSDYRDSISPERARRMSPAARFLYGFSANGLRRG